MCGSQIRRHALLGVTCILAWLQHVPQHDHVTIITASCVTRNKTYRVVTTVLRSSGVLKTAASEQTRMVLSCGRLCTGTIGHVA